MAHLDNILVMRVSHWNNADFRLVVPVCNMDGSLLSGLAEATARAEFAQGSKSHIIFSGSAMIGCTEDAVALTAEASEFEDLSGPWEGDVSVRLDDGSDVTVATISLTLQRGVTQWPS